MKQNNHKADQANANKGTKGVNETYAKAQGARGADLNPNNPKKQAERSPAPAPKVGTKN